MNDRTTFANPTAGATRIFFRRMAVVTLAYVATTIVASLLASNEHVPGPLRYAIMLAPLVPAAFWIPAIVRFLRETDEFERRIVLESQSIAFAVTAILAVTYGFFEFAGLPHLSAWWTYGILMGSWLVARFVVVRRYL